ncbi:MAG: hypothetical protein F7B19_03855 [Desulfurococcales archaeon]|nr:hypothetical protein [Desulfurococcales archaeon]
MINVSLVGFGNVGRELLLRLVEVRKELDVNITSISSSRGSVIVAGPGDLAYAVKLAHEGRKLHEHEGFREGMGPVEASVVGDADLAMITMPPSYFSGEPNKSVYYGLIEEGISIITADKTVLALEGRRFLEYAAKAGVYVGYRATVAAGTPAIDAALGLRLRGVESIRAVLNASTNYILGFVEKGLSFEEAIRESIKAKLAEPDPSIDTHGWDPAAKLVILSNTLGADVKLDLIERTPVDSIGEDVVRNSLREGKRVKYIAYADFNEGVYRVRPEVIPRDDPLAMAEGEENVIVFTLEGTEIVLKGPAGPAWRTAKVMVTDILDYIRWRNLVEEH